MRNPLLIPASSGPWSSSPPGFQQQEVEQWHHRNSPDVRYVNDAFHFGAVGIFSNRMDFYVYGEDGNEIINVIVGSLATGGRFGLVDGGFVNTGQVNGGFAR